MNRLFIRTLPFLLTIAVLMIGLAPYNAQSNLAKATSSPVAVLAFDGKESKLMRTPPEQWVAKPESINYKELASDIVNIFKWMEEKDMTLASFLNKFAGYDSNCQNECFIKLSSEADSSLSGLKGARYISHVEFSVYRTSGKDIIPDIANIIIKDTYHKNFSASLFYQELTGRRVSYEERLQRVHCEKKREDCPKVRSYSQNVKKKYFGNSSTKSLYNVIFDEHINNTKKHFMQIRVSLR